MADPSPKEKHIFRLSAIDQSVSRSYITVALCYPCDAELVDSITTRFRAAIKRTISHLPMLAGTLRSASGGSGGDRGFVEITVSLEMIKSFAPKVKRLPSGTEGSIEYAELVASRVPSSKLESEHFAPLAQKTDPLSGEAFAAQLNIIPGGLIAVLQLHHTVADLHGLQTILKILSQDSEPRELSHDALSWQAVESSRHRDHLSDSGSLTPIPAAPTGPNPGLAFGDLTETEIKTCVLGIKLSIIDATTSMVTDRLFDPYNRQIAMPVATSDVLSAILWRAVSRARLAACAMYLMPPQYPGQPHPMSSLTLPTSIREIMQPSISKTYFGNAIANATPTQEIAALSMPIGVGEIQTTSGMIRAEVNNLNERKVRMAIANIKNSDYTHSTTTTAANGITDVVITSWEDILPEEAHLSLGLGEPSFVRKLSSNDSDEGSTIHKRPSQESGEPWEVTVQLNKRAMECLLKDEGVMKFVEYADGARYVNGTPEAEDTAHQQAMESEYERLGKRLEWRSKRGMDS